MEDITRNYYKNNKKFMKKLIETGSVELIHSGPRIDGFWGVNKNESNNYHGKTLMLLRDEFKDIDIDEKEVKEEEVKEEEVKEEEVKEDKKKDKKKDISEGDNVTWTIKGKTFKGVVLKVDKRMKTNLNVMNSDGDIVKVKKTLLNVE